MKKLLGLVICMCVAAVLTMGTTGCTKDKPKTTPTPVTGGKTDKDKDHKIEVKADPKTMDAKPGETKTAKLTLTRGKDATHDVTFKAESKEGVTASAAKVAGDETKGELSIEVDKKAKDGDYVVTVTAKSKDAKDATATVTVTVKGKEVAVVPEKDYSLKATDAKAVMIKQGESKTATVTFTLGKDLKEVTLKVKDAKGVKGKAEPTTLKESGDVKVTIDVAADAEAGDATLTIEATGENAVPATATAKIAIEVKKK
jgi:uncharacterized membrane protein